VIVVGHADQLQMSVTDDGVGLDSTRRGEGLGLRGIEERVKERRGAMRIESAPGEGTKMEIRLPFPTGTDLGLSTVETHRANLMQKLNLHNTAVIVPVIIMLPRHHVVRIVARGASCRGCVMHEDVVRHHAGRSIREVIATRASRACAKGTRKYQIISAELRY
jgi:hypothetical protein